MSSKETGDSDSYKSDGILDPGKSPEGKLIGNDSHIVSSISRYDGYKYSVSI